MDVPLCEIDRNGSTTWQLDQSTMQGINIFHQIEQSNQQATMYEINKKCFICQCSCRIPITKIMVNIYMIRYVHQGASAFVVSWNSEKHHGDQQQMYFSI